jgi:hypothetical protein
MSAVTQAALINEDKMREFLGKVVGDFWRRTTRGNRKLN